jgi:hypothetical protein
MHRVVADRPRRPGRAELLEEISEAPRDLRTYLARQFADLQAIPDFLLTMAAMLRPDPASQARAEAVVLPRIQQIVSSD